MNSMDFDFKFPGGHLRGRGRMGLLALSVFLGGILLFVLADGNSSKNQPPVNPDAGLTRSVGSRPAKTASGPQNRRNFRSGTLSQFP